MDAAKIINGKTFEVVLGGGHSMHGNSFNRYTYKIDGKRVKHDLYISEMNAAYKAAGIENPRVARLKEWIASNKEKLEKTPGWDIGAVKSLKKRIADAEAELLEVL